MANPKFTDEDGNNSYIWEEWSVLPGDRPDLSTPINVRNFVIEHQRLKVVFAREVIAQLVDLTFMWKNISVSMVNSIKYYYGLRKFRYYPDASGGNYITMYMNGTFSPQAKRGNGYDLTIRLLEI